MLCRAHVQQYLLHCTFQVPADWECFITQQRVRPPGWNDQQFGRFEPCDILTAHKVPSRNHSGTNYNVAILYVPQELSTELTEDNMSGNVNWMGYPREAGRYRFICCGPSTGYNSCCPVGSRTVGPCAHGQSIVVAGSVFSHNPGAYQTRHLPVNILDPGNGLPMAAAIEMISGLFN